MSETNFVNFGLDYNMISPIVSIKFDGSFSDSFFEDLKKSLAENHTCVLIIHNLGVWVLGTSIDHAFSIYSHTVKFFELQLEIQRSQTKDFGKDNNGYNFLKLYNCEDNFSSVEFEAYVRLLEYNVLVFLIGGC